MTDSNDALLNLYSALRALTEAAEAAGWDVDADNAPILDVARGALADAEKSVAAAVEG